MADPKPKPVIVIYVTRDGVETVQVHSPGRLAEREGTALYERIRPIVDRLDRVARGNGGRQ